MEKKRNYNTTVSERIENDIPIKYWVDADGVEIELNPVTVDGFEFDVNDMAVIESFNQWVLTDVNTLDDNDINSAKIYINLINPILDLYNSLQRAYKKLDANGRMFSHNSKSDSRQLAKNVYQKIIHPTIQRQLSFDMLLQNVGFLGNYKLKYDKAEIENAKRKSKDQLTKTELQVDVLHDCVSEYSIKSIRNLGRLFPDYLKDTTFCKPIKSNGRQKSDETTANNTTANNTTELKLDLNLLSNQLKLYFADWIKLHETEPTEQIVEIDVLCLSIHDLLENGSMLNETTEIKTDDIDTDALDAELKEIDQFTSALA